MKNLFKSQQNCIPRLEIVHKKEKVDVGETLEGNVKLTDEKHKTESETTNLKKRCLETEQKCSVFENKQTGLNDATDVAFNEDRLSNLLVVNYNCVPECFLINNFSVQLTELNNKIEYFNDWLDELAFKMTSVLKKEDYRDGNFSQKSNQVDYDSETKCNKKLTASIAYLFKSFDDLSIYENALKSSKLFPEFYIT